MRTLIVAAALLFASTASAQNMWQMNAAYQNQINTAQQAAWTPYYAPVYPVYAPYRPIYSPRYYGPISQRAFQRDFDRSLDAMDIENAIRDQTMAQQQSAWEIKRAIDNASFEQTLNEMRRPVLMNQP
jgi:hypothetical protein